MVIDWQLQTNTVSVRTISHSLTGLCFAFLTRSCVLPCETLLMLLRVSVLLTEQQKTTARNSVIKRYSILYHYWLTNRWELAWTAYPLCLTHNYPFGVQAPVGAKWCSDSMHFIRDNCTPFGWFVSSEHYSRGTPAIDTWQNSIPVLFF